MRAYSSALTLCDFFTASVIGRSPGNGAGFVVGPLTKEDVAAIAPLAAGRVPMLALNFLGDGSAAARNVFQFALLPEDEARMAAACDSFLAATDVADYLVGKGVSFREAHHVTGTLVRRCLDAGTDLTQVGLDELRTLSPAFAEDFYFNQQE